MTVLILLALVAISAFFSGAETALFSMRESQVRMMERAHERSARIIGKLKRDPHRVLVTILSGNTLVNVSVGSISAMLAYDETGSSAVGLITAISTVAILVFGEIFPKSLAISHNKSFAQIVAYPIYFLYLAFYPISSLFVALERLTRKRGGSSHDKVSEEEIRVMSDLGLEHGGIDDEERKLIDNIFKFDDIPVGRIMTKKADIDALSGDVPIAQIAYYVSQSGFSRFPVYDGKDDNYIGYVHTNDVMRVLNSDEREEPLARFASPVTRVSEDTDIRKVFRLMTKERSHLYLVHEKEEVGRVVGIVTMEDILEEIMGEIEDEGDRRDSGWDKVQRG